MGKKSPAPPPAPDYAAAATAQGAANLDAARLTARLSNPNISTPLGGQRVTFGRQVLNEPAYNKAMADYQQQLDAYNASRPQQPATGDVTSTTGGTPGRMTAQGLERAPGMPESDFLPQDMGNVGLGDLYGGGGIYGGGYGGGLQSGYGGTTGGYTGGPPIAPTKEQFMTTTDQDTPYIEQYLTPEAQKTLEAQQRVDLALANLGSQGIGVAQDVLGQRFNPNLRDLQTQLGGYGQVAQGPNLMGMGQAGANVNAQRVNRGPMEGQYGYAQGLNLGGLPQAPINAGTTAQQAIMGRLQPQLERQRAQLQTQLANQGIPPGSEAYRAAMTEQNQRENDLVSQAALQGISLDQAARQQAFGERATANQAYNQAVQQNLAQGLSVQDAQNRAAQQMFGQRMDIQGLYNTALAQNQNAALQQQAAANAAQAQQFNQALQGAQFGNTALQQSLAQQLALRNQPLNEITALMSGSQVQMPQFQGYTGANVGAAPVFGAAQAQDQAAMNRYGIQANQAANNMSGLFGLAGAIAGAPAGGFLSGLIRSDRRLKSNIERVGTHRLGIGIYEYDIEGRRERGVMADEVETVMPNAVMTGDDGYKRVNYRML